MELATVESGATVIAASSFDHKHAPGSILDETSDFWMSTGIYPQEIVLQLGGPPSFLKSVDIISTGIRHIQVAKCEGSQANSWELVSQAEANDSDGEIQRLSISVPNRATATYVRLKVSLNYLFHPHCIGFS
jgi:hypothetical protein